MVKITHCCSSRVPKYDFKYPSSVQLPVTPTPRGANTSGLCRHPNSYAQTSTDTCPHMIKINKDGLEVAQQLRALVMARSSGTCLQSRNWEAEAEDLCTFKALVLHGSSRTARTRDPVSEKPKNNQQTTTKKSCCSCRT